MTYRPPKEFYECLAEEMDQEHRFLIKRLRQRKRLTQMESEYLADQLELLWFPKSKAGKEIKARKGADWCIMWAETFDDEIEVIRAAEKIPKHEAIDRVVADNKLHSHEALVEYIKRGKRLRNRK